ncbi:MAG: polysaccharide biosynthesis/export family protein [Candidatus Omnitrophota bacterium]|nr:polysaccharide biosynthesis/export family protein [Candidatus Omnitrophota bacterium]
MKSYIFIFCVYLMLNFSNVFCEEYKVETGDVLTITVYEQSDLTTKARVGSKGEIAFPLIGNVDVGGLTATEIEKKITSLLEADYLVNPQVNVFIEEYHPKKVFVMGFVNNPGEYELSKDRPTTVLEAITMAGGFKQGAAQNGTKVIRMEDGKEVTIQIRVTDITNKGYKESDIPVKPGDIVVVPESFF